MRPTSPDAGFKVEAKELFSAHLDSIPLEKT